MATGHSFKNPEMIIAVSALIVSLITAFASIYSAFIDSSCNNKGSRRAATALLGTWRRIAHDCSYCLLSRLNCLGRYRQTWL